MAKEDYMIDFWVKFIESDTMERHNMVRDLPTLQGFKKILEKEDSKLVGIAFDGVILSILEDLLETAIIYNMKEE